MQLLYHIFQSAAPDPLLPARVILALVCVVVASSLALGLCVGLVRRMQIISPERPEPQPADAEHDGPPSDQPRDRV